MRLEASVLPAIHLGLVGMGRTWGVGFWIICFFGGGFGFLLLLLFLLFFWGGVVFVVVFGGGTCPTWNPPASLEEPRWIRPLSPCASSFWTSWPGAAKLLCIVLVLQHQ